MFGFGEHPSSDHGSHASNDACTHATDHYHDSVHAFSRDAGHAVDSAFGNGHHHVTAGQMGVTPRNGKNCTLSPDRSRKWFEVAVLRLHASVHYGGKLKLSAIP